MATEFQLCSDEELARQTQAGSLPAFEALVYRYEGRIYGFVANSCRNGTDAREVTQDTFVRAFQAIGQFDARRGFAAWLFTIARRKCIDQYRSALPVSSETVPEQADDNDPAELLVAAGGAAGFVGPGAPAPAGSQFQALWLRYAEGMSVAGIAQVLRKTQIHIKVLLFRARQSLGRDLAARQVPGMPGGRNASEPGRGVAASGSASVEVGNRLGGSRVMQFSGALVGSVSAGARKGPL